MGGRPAGRRLIQPTQSLRRRSLLAAAASSFLLSACGADTGDQPSAATATDLAGRLGDALGAGSVDRFTAAFTPGARPLADRLWRTWHEVCSAVAVASADGGLQVTWRLPGEPATSVDRLLITSVDGRIAALEPNGQPAPVWLDEQLTAATLDAATVLAGAGQPADVVQSWLALTQDASRVVATASLGQAVASWDGVLRLVLPSEQASFVRLTGLAADVAAATQAATILTSRASVPRMIINPSWVGELPGQSRLPLLVHEGVHQAAVSAVSSAPLWVSEGTAEWVAQQADPATRRANLALVRSAPEPVALPSEADLGGPDAPRAYALAALAVQATAGRWGRPAMLRWLADWQGADDRPSDAALTSTYRAAWADLA